MVRASRNYFSFVTRLVATTLLAATCTTGTAAQEGKPQWLPRDELIGAIIGFVASNCGKLDELLTALVEPYCKDPTGGFAMHMLARLALGPQSDEALRALCRKHGISECQTQEETSRGQPLFVLDSVIAIAGSPMKATWSPDNRFLLFDTLGKTGVRVLDLASRQLLDKSLTKLRLQAAAWSPDSTYAAVMFLGGIRIVSAASWEDVSVMTATPDGCYRKSALAFTADARSLWVACGENDFQYTARVASKLSVPELKIEDELVVSAPPGVGRAAFWTDAITPNSDDLILAGYFYQRDEKGMRQGGTGLTALSLATKKPVYPHFQAGSGSIIRRADDLSRVLLYSARAVQSAEMKGETPKDWKIETWDTRTGERVGTFGGTTDAGSYMMLPVPVPKSNLLIAAVGSRSSSRKTLIIMDDRTGAVVQEIGPLPTPVGIVVSTDGSRAALFGFNETRIYRLNRQD